MEPSRALASLTSLSQRSVYQVLALHARASERAQHLDRRRAGARADLQNAQWAARVWPARNSTACATRSL